MGQETPDNRAEKLSETTPVKPRAHDSDQDMGSALRSVYQQTVDEAVPSDLMDLLGKLE